MSTVIRYVTGWKQGDAFLCDGQCGTGIWATASRGYAPLEFASEADAKRFLITHNYDLPPLNVVFEMRS